MIKGVEDDGAECLRFRRTLELKSCDGDPAVYMFGENDDEGRGISSINDFSSSLGSP